MSTRLNGLRGTMSRRPTLDASSQRRLTRRSDKNALTARRMMTSEGFLMAVAQVAVALAGFSGPVVATRGASPSGWSRRDTWSLAGMFGASIGALFLALLPSLLLFSRLPTETGWMMASGFMADFLIVIGF